MDAAPGMKLVHLTASTFFGGPERQMLGLAAALRGRVETRILSFSEGGRCWAFVEEAKRREVPADALKYDTPNLLAATRELTARLREAAADVLLCHGYKANLIGRLSARRLGIPAIAVSRGWTGENWRVRLYETLDRSQIHRMDAVVAVSEGQAAKIYATGLDPAQVTVIRNSARNGAFPPPSVAGRQRLAAFAPTPGDVYVVTAARLSPEKGIDVLIDAAREVTAAHPGVRFLVFGDGDERGRLQARIARAGLADKFALCGFQSDLDQLWPSADLSVLPSFTEGLPNVVLEASAAGVPVVATAAGGTPEAIEDGTTGVLVPPGDRKALAHAISALIQEPEARQRMGDAGREFVKRNYSFARQADLYLALFRRLGIRPAGVAAA